MAWTLVTSGQDRADFVDAESVSSALLAFTTANSASGASTGVMDVRRWPFLQMFGQMGDGGGVVMTLFVSWYADVGGTLTMGKTIYNTLLGADIVDAIPNQGPYCVVIINFSDAGAHNSTVRLMGRTTSGLGGAGEYTGGAFGELVAHMTFQLVGIGAQINTVGNFVQRGIATLTLRADVPGGGAAGIGIYGLVQYMDASGVWFSSYGAVFAHDIGQEMQCIQVPLGSSLCRLVVVNTQAAAANCEATLVLNPSNR